MLLGGSHPDSADRARIEDALVIAVQCAIAGGTCFCVSMGTGPVAEKGFDLGLTEVIETDEQLRFDPRGFPRRHARTRAGA